MAMNTARATALRDAVAAANDAVQTAAAQHRIIRTQLGEIFQAVIDAAAPPPALPTDLEKNTAYDALRAIVVDLGDADPAGAPARAGADVPTDAHCIALVTAYFGIAEATRTPRAGDAAPHITMLRRIPAVQAATAALRGGKRKNRKANRKNRKTSRSANRKNRNRKSSRKNRKTNRNRKN
jgi:hypothetical protein